MIRRDPSRGRLLRRARLLVIPAALLAVQACVSDDDAGSPGLNLPDASLDASVAAPDTGTPVQPQPDATPDAAPDGPNVGPVTVVVTDGTKAPVAGVKVAFYDATGNATLVETGANGQATHVMGPGGSVVAAERNEGLRRLTSILGVEPLDVLAIGGGDLAPAFPQDFGTITFTATQYGPASSHEISAGCNSVSIPATGPTPDMIITDNCVGSGGKVALLAIAKDEGGQAIAYAIKEATLAQKGASQNVTIVASDWTPTTAGTFSLTGTPTPLFQSGYFSTSYLKNGLTFLDQVTPIDPATLVNLPFDRAPSTADAGPSFADLFLNVTYQSFADGPDGGAVSNLQPVSLLIKQEVPPVSFPVTRTFQDFLPRVHSVIVNGTTEPTLTWSSDAAVSAVGGIADFRNTLLTDAGPEALEWRVIFPSTTTQLTVPPLPAALADFRPAQAFGLHSMSIIDSPEVGSYKVFRAGAAPYAGLIDEVTYPLPKQPLTARVSGVRFFD